MLNKLRLQLTFWYSLGILTVIVFLLFFFYWATAKIFYGQVDETLGQHAKAIAVSVERGAEQSGCGCLSSESSFLNGVLQMPGMPTAIFDENGQVVKSSADFVAPPNFSSPSNYFNAPLSGQTYRFLNTPIVSNNQQIGSVLMGHSIDAFLKTRRILLFLLIFLILLILLPVILLGRFLTEKALKKEKQFLGDMAHSLKTPLAVLQSQLEVKLVKFDQLTQSSLLSQVSKLSSLVNETLESNYLASDQKNAGTDLTSLLRELCEITQALGLEKKISLIQNLPSTLFWIKGSKQQLAKAFLAVLENAVNYSKTKGEITVSLKKDNPVSAGSRQWRDNRAIVTIADNGAGIDKEDLPYVFDRFYRGRHAKISGHGLGLSIAKNIIEELGGTINLESKLNKGTIVIIKLSSIKLSSQP